MKANSPLEGCTKEHKQQLYDLLHVYMGLFQEPKGLAPKMEVEHKIQLLLNTSLLNIGLYRLSIIKINELKK